nr:MAG TPA: Portal protein [Caudoviricetes sp.]
MERGNYLQMADKLTSSNRPKRDQKTTFAFRPSAKKATKNLEDNYDSITDTLNLSLFGTTQTDDSESLSTMFNNIMQTELNSLNRHSETDITGFIARLYDHDTKQLYSGKENSIEQIFGMESNEVFNFITDAYQNKKLKQNDLKEVSNQLIELREAILVFRDSIVSANVTDGKISKTITIENATQEEKDMYDSALEQLDTKFNLNNRIKNFIIPNTLTQGSYYAYVIPYKRLFGDFSLKKKKDPRYRNTQMNESADQFSLYETFTESVDDARPHAVKENGSFNDFIDECYDMYFSEASKKEFDNISDTKEKKKLIEDQKASFATEMTELAKRIEIDKNNVPIPFLIYGEGVYELANATDEERERFFTEAEVSLDNARQKLNIGDSSYKEIKKEEKIFASIGDCYLKLIDSPHMIELRIMNKVLGYYYILEEDIKPISGVISSTMYYNRFDDVTRQKTIIDKLVQKIVNSFDQKFIKENKEFKEMIAEALMFYDLNHKRIKFQFIPAEYVCPFKVNEDEDGNGISVIEPSLFYAKLYLMLLLFKIMSIVLYSNDTRVNYIKQSGIDKNIANKIQEIARKKQERSVNIMDLFSYTTLIKKVGNGAELYIPTGRSGERGIETEILQGQDVQLNTDLMEMLRKQFILGTGVPDAIMNYLNEADFAKSIEMANTKFQGRVMSLQLDFNKSLTQFYQMLARFSLDMDLNLVNKITYKLEPPKFNNNNITSDMIGAVTSIVDYICNLILGEQYVQDPGNTNVVKEFRQLVVEDYLPSINIGKLNEYKQKAILNSKKEEFNPTNNNTDDIDSFVDELT